MPFSYEYVCFHHWLCKDLGKDFYSFLEFSMQKNGREGYVRFCFSRQGDVVFFHHLTPKLILAWHQNHRHGYLFFTGMQALYRWKGASLKQTCWWRDARLRWPVTVWINCELFLCPFSKCCWFQVPLPLLTACCCSLVAHFKQHINSFQWCDWVSQASHQSVSAVFEAHPDYIQNE